MFLELSKVDERYDAVMAVIRDGLSVTEAAAGVRVARQAVLVREQSESLGQVSTVRTAQASSFQIPTKPPPHTRHPGVSRSSSVPRSREERERAILLAGPPWLPRGDLRLPMGKLHCCPRTQRLGVSLQTLVGEVERRKASATAETCRVRCTHESQPEQLRLQPHGRASWRRRLQVGPRSGSWVRCAASARLRGRRSNRGVTLQRRSSSGASRRSERSPRLVEIRSDTLDRVAHCRHTRSRPRHRRARASSANMSRVRSASRKADAAAFLHSDLARPRGAAQDHQHDDQPRPQPLQGSR